MTMHTIKLKIEDKVYDKFIWLLSKFTKDEVEIIVEETNFIKTKKHLETELDEILEDKAEFLTLNETEQRLENLIRKHEDHL
jgi:predicted lipoprotein